jgi:hypothetical protein
MVLGLVVGFGISYRASQGYANFQEGRQRWADVTRISRTMGRLCWNHVPERIDSPAGTETEEEKRIAREEKRKFMGERDSADLKEQGQTDFDAQDLSRRSPLRPSTPFAERTAVSSSRTSTTSSHGYLVYVLLSLFPCKV